MKEIMCCIVCCETSLLCAGPAATTSKWVKNYPYIDLTHRSSYNNIGLNTGSSRDRSTLLVCN